MSISLKGRLSEGNLGVLACDVGIFDNYLYS